MGPGVHVSSLDILGIATRSSGKGTLALAAHPAIARIFALRTTIDVFDQVILKLVLGEAGTGLVAAINYGDVGLDVLLQQPSQELTAAIGFVRS